ncbi:MAG: cysteine desulfurase [Bifidobacteriaceae bacterium]|nr:cysteine desulfurase [Bifidobacteriaceae bacterium]
MKTDIYLDYAASAPIRAAALEAYVSAPVAANPSSVHRPGRQAAAQLDQARIDLAQTVGAEPGDVVFTSGGTEADALAVTGLFAARQTAAARPYLLVGATEHVAVLENADRLPGAEVIRIPVDRNGFVDTAFVAEHLAERAQQTALISVMAANNETGAIQDLDRITQLAAAAGVPVHSDWVAAAGKLSLNFAASGLAAVSLSAHKVGGPGGVGALLVRRGTALEPRQAGGGQEGGLRSGTQDPRGAAGFAAALVEAAAEDTAGLETLLGPLDALAAAHPAIRVLTPPAHLPGLRSLLVDQVRGESLVFLLDSMGIACSAGSACHAGVVGPSHVLEAMGLDRAAASAALRVSIGHATTAADVEALVKALPEAITRAQRVAQTEGGRP